MLGFYLPLPTGGRKVATLPLPKRRYYGRRFRKLMDLNSATATIPDSFGSLSAGPAGSLSAGLTVSLSASLVGFFEPAVAVGSLSIAGFAAASAFGENLIRNCIEFRNLG